MVIERSSPVFFVFIFGFGMILGLIYFGGLWITVKKTVVSTSPQRLLYGSLILRFGLCLSSFYFLLVQGCQLLVAAMSGFFLVRYFWLFVASKPHIRRSIHHREVL